jgi:hypothetical protein
MTQVEGRRAGTRRAPVQQSLQQSRCRSMPVCAGRLIADGRSAVHAGSRPDEALDALGEPLGVVGRYRDWGPTLTSECGLYNG